MVFETLIRPASKAPDPFEPISFPSLFLRAPVKLLLHHIYHLLNNLRSSPTPSTPPIRIVCISDTHTHIPKDVPPGDILVHAGDMTNEGSIEELQKQIDWLASLPHKEVIVISGNHDTFLDPRTRPSLPESKRTGAIDWKRVHYLQHRRLSLTITIDPSDSETNESERSRLIASGQKQRRIVFYGAPQIPACGPMSVHAFQYERGQDAWSETVPEDTDILITHTPPKNHRDLSLPNGLGCEYLAAEVKRVKPTIHIFGHVHWGAGKEVVWWDRCHEAYEQGMYVQSKWTRGILNPWLWLYLFRVGYRGLRGLIWDKVWGGQGPNTILVNAAQMRGNTGMLGNPAQTVDI